MNQQKRLLLSLQGKPVDRCPFICPGGMMSMAVVDIMDASGFSWPQAHWDPEKMAGLTLAAHAMAGVENVGIPFCMTVEAEALGAKVDLGGKSMEPRIIAYPMKDVAAMDELSAMDVSKGRLKACIEAMALLKEKAPDTPAIANLTGPVSLGASLMDAIGFYRALLKEGEKAEKFLDFLTDNLLLFGREMIRAGADAVCIADPSASGEILGKRSFDRFALPAINRLVEGLRETSTRTIPVIVHICGNVKSLGNSLDSIAAEALSVDSLVSISLLRELAPSKIAMGNVSTFKLERGSAESIFKAGRTCLERGANILAPACGISPRTSVNNIKSLARAVLKPC